jgi:sulfoxide reductase heme-binding subunit YedZ
VLHFIWLVKSDLRDPLIFAAVFVLLMAFRISGWLGGRGRKKSRPPGATRRAAMES